MAHAILADEIKKRSLAIKVYSAGVIDCSDEPQLEEITRTCLRNNTPPPSDSPTFVRQLPLESIDRFLVMEQYHAEVLTREHGIAVERVSLLGDSDPQARGSEIPDPFGGGKIAYERSYKLIRDCVLHYLDSTDDLIGRRSNP